MEPIAGGLLRDLVGVTSNYHAPFQVPDCYICRASLVPAREVGFLTRVPACLAAERHSSPLWTTAMGSTVLLHDYSWGAQWIVALYPTLFTQDISLRLSFLTLIKKKFRPILQPGLPPWLRGFDLYFETDLRCLTPGAGPPGKQATSCGFPQHTQFPVHWHGSFDLLHS